MWESTIFLTVSEKDWDLVAYGAVALMCGNFAERVRRQALTVLKGKNCHNGSEKQMFGTCENVLGRVVKFSAENNFLFLHFSAFHLILEWLLFGPLGCFVKSLVLLGVLRIPVLLSIFLGRALGKRFVLGFVLGWGWRRSRVSVCIVVFVLLLFSV